MWPLSMGPAHCTALGDTVSARSVIWRLAPRMTRYGCGSSPLAGVVRKPSIAGEYATTDTHPAVRTSLRGNSFTEDVGGLFEQNVGRQLATIPNSQLYPETSTTRENDQSTGSWSDNAVAVILVEVKLAHELVGVPGTVGLDRVGHENCGLTWRKCGVV